MRGTRALFLIPHDEPIRFLVYAFAGPECDQLDPAACGYAIDDTELADPEAPQRVQLVLQCLAATGIGCNRFERLAQLAFQSRVKLSNKARESGWNTQRIQWLHDSDDLTAAWPLYLNNSSSV